MLDLSHIFPNNYPNQPTETDLQFEVREMLCRCGDDKQIMDWLNRIACPYLRKAMCLCFRESWHELEKIRDDRTGFYDGDGGWRISWIYLDSDIKQIVKQANLQQIEMEQQEQETMPIIQTTYIPKQMTKEVQPTQQIKMENCNVLMGNSYGGIFPLPGAHVTVNQYANEEKGEPQQTIEGPNESVDERERRKKDAMQDMCSKLDNLHEEMLGYMHNGNRISYAQLRVLMLKILGMIERGSKQDFAAIQEGIWVILIDKRDKCHKDPKYLYFSQTFLGIVGYLCEQKVINGGIQDILNCLFHKPEASMRKCIERGIVSAFPEGTEDMLDFYIKQLKEGKII